jgi:hypothetical protein
MSVAAKFKFVSRQHHVESSLHLLRALLRECTYLPDPASQVYIKKYVVYRFRNASERGVSLLRQAGSSFGHGTQQEADEVHVLQQSLRKGYKGLYQLIRANEGEIRPLMRILRHTYGRNGPRRYELMRMLLAPDVDFSTPSDTVSEPPEGYKKWGINTASTPDVLESPSPVTGDMMVYSISPRYSKLKAIAATQAQKNIESNRTRLSKRISIPTKNAWGRQMPRKRVKNMVKSKYADFLDGILPPLPEQEWHYLQGLALGTIPWDGCKTRRKRPAGCPAFLSASDLEKLVHVSDKLGESIHLDQLYNNPSAVGTSKADKIITAAGNENIRGYWRVEDTWLGDEGGVDDALEAVLQDELQLQTLNKSQEGKHRGHRITHRFMRRLWMEIFMACPMLQHDGADRKWKVLWGSSSRTKPGSLPAARMEELFGLELPGEQQAT